MRRTTISSAEPSSNRLELSQNASGEAEVEYDKAAPAKQEVEFSVRNLPPGVALTFVIDGTEVATAAADRRGRSEVELDVQFPGTPAAR